MRDMLRTLLLALCLLPCIARADAPFGIQIIDDQTGRGVPMVELETLARVRYVTDSAGFVAIDDPALFNGKVFFTITTPGYEFPVDGFGSRGKALPIKPGETETLKIKRLNIAERVYRVTGEGIYRDSVLLGRKPPIAQPLVNAQVVGQDSVQATPYGGKLYFFWGDTLRQSYPLGQFRTAGATADLTTDPSTGVDLRYFTNNDGFARAMVPGAEPGVVWIEGLFTVKDDNGRERLLAHASRMQGLAKRLARALLVFDDESQTFKTLKDIDLDAPLAPVGQATRVTDGGVDYIYFTAPYPSIRVRATWKDATDPAAYEAYVSERGADGKPTFVWKRGATPVRPSDLKPGEGPFRLQDKDGKPFTLHGASVRWNEYRKRWVMIGVQHKGATIIGEVWYAEAERPEGPWDKAVKVATHHRDAEPPRNIPPANYDFYNPVHHAFFDQDGGRVIYFEGTLSTMFSADLRPVPRYDYNQLMYRLDLSDERLRK